MSSPVRAPQSINSAGNVVIWFRRDLRSTDHEALACAFAEAAQRGTSVLPLFVLDPKLLRGSANRQAFLLGALRALRSGGIPIMVRSGDPAHTVAAVAREVSADVVYCSHDYAPYGQTRDRSVAEALQIEGLAFRREGGPYAVPPGTTRKGDGTPFKVFTPFRRVWEQQADSAVEDHCRRPQAQVGGPWLTGVASESIPNNPEGASTRLPEPSESAAHERLDRFCEGQLADYRHSRDNPAADATSHLSAYLKFGILHPLQILPRLGSGPGPDTFRSELAWREFYADVLYHRPETAHAAFNVAMDDIEVDSGPDADERFAVWCHGRTGYPFIDAGMRQLLAEGWMHNRVRMATASFLVKDLHLDWRRGAAWFMEHLVDGDVASNQHGWQWAAGTGTDAAPYFRVFNPTTQSRKFDPSGAYIRRYVPELAQLDDKSIHEPASTASPSRPSATLFATLFDTTVCNVSDADGQQSGDDSRYPAPIVDHGEERLEALRRYGIVRETPSSTDMRGR